jgi:tRNA (adenine57-N1/adenine58-N1)-methyltransferase
MLQKAADASATGPETIQEGDLVIVYERHDKMKPVYVNSTDKYTNRYGTFLHKDWIGVPFGSKVSFSVLK